MICSLPTFFALVLPQTSNWTLFSQKQRPQSHVYFCFMNQEPREWCKHLTWPQTILWALRTEHRTSWEEVTVTDWVAEQTARALQPAVCVVCGKALITYHCDHDHWLAPDSAGRQPSLTTPSEQSKSVGWGHCSKRPWHQSP